MKVIKMVCRRQRSEDEHITGNEFWFAFETVAKAAGTSKGNVLTTLSEQHTNLSSAVRVAVLTYYVERAQMLEAIMRNANT
jgi:predicted DNA-binding ribbon-helix-helix protein